MTTIQRPLIIQKQIDNAHHETLVNFSHRVTNEMARQITLWGEQNLPDGTGSQYDRQSRHYRQLTDIKMKNGTGTWGDIFLEEVFELMAEEDPEKFEVEAVQVEAVLHSWLISRARRPFIQCVGECPDGCAKCSSGNWDLMCDECRFYAAQDCE